MLFITKAAAKFVDTNLFNLFKNISRCCKTHEIIIRSHISNSSSCGNNQPSYLNLHIYNMGQTSLFEHQASRLHRLFSCFQVQDLAAGFFCGGENKFCAFCETPI
jgi:hypothetical protein